MSLRSRISTWWKAVSHPASLERDMQDELQFHIASYAENLMHNGVPREEAMRRARAELGSIDAVREKCRAAWGTRFIDDLRNDLRYASRMLGKSPGFAAIAIGSLALGIGANTVIFTAAQHMLLDRLNVPHPEQLRLLEFAEPGNGVVEQTWGWGDNGPNGEQLYSSFSYPVYRQLRRDNRVFESLFGFRPLDRVNVTIHGHPRALAAEMVSGNYYSALGVRPQIGRGIQESDDGAVGSGPVVVISDRLWKNQFNRSRDAIGKHILVNMTPMTIVGVNPPGFTGAFSAQSVPDIFFPLSMQPIAAPQNFAPNPSLLTNNDLWWVMVMGRIQPGISDSAAAASLDVALKAAVHATMTVKDNKQLPNLLLVDGSRGQDVNARDMSKPIYVLLSLAGFVLLLACANLANLLLARASARQREMSVRFALGAGRGRILRQMLVESLMLSLSGGVAGLLIAFALRDSVPRLLSDSWSPPAFSARFGWHIFAFAAAISIVTGIVFGLAPAWQATRTQVASGLKESGQTSTRRRRGLAGKSIVVFQVALSMLLVVGSGLFVQTVLHLGHSRLGFRPDHLLLFSIEPPQIKYPKAKSTPLYRELDRKLEAIPGVQSVTLTNIPFIADSRSNNIIILPGHRSDARDNPSVLTNDVGEHFFSTYGIPIVAGRSFDSSDTKTSRKVVVINESFARKYFPNVNPLGRSFDAGWKEDIVHVEIVGICGDAKYENIRTNPQPTYYAPYFQQKDGIDGATFAISTRMSAESIVPALRTAVQSVDRNLPLLDVRTQNEQIASNMRQERIFADLTAAFGILALVLAWIGIYGIMAYSVSRRTNEIGVRMALGALPKQVRIMILREAGWMAALGIAAGLCVALVLGRIVASLLYGLKPWDPITLVGGIVLLAIVAIAASWVPAHRAASVDPMQALRHE